MSPIVTLQSKAHDIIKSMLYFDKDGNHSSTKFWAFVASAVITGAYMLATAVMYGIVLWKGKDFPSDDWSFITLTYGGILISNSIASKIIEHRTKVSLGKINGNISEQPTQEQPKPTQEEK